MDQTLLVVAFIAAIGLILVALGVWAIPKLKNEKQGYPLEAEIEKALLPFAYQAIVTAYHLSEQAVDEMGRRIDGCDKKVIADMAYALLPSKIGDFDLRVVKSMIPPERFEQVVQDAFDEGMQLYYKYADRYKKAFEVWKTQNTAG